MVDTSGGRSMAGRKETEGGLDKVEDTLVAGS